MIVIDKSNHRNNSPPPPLTLDDVTKSVLIVDKYGSWLHQWTDTFKALRIPHLRSLMSAHACPYDHRSLEYYAEKKGRGDELITLRNLDQRDKTFKGPYQVSIYLFMYCCCCSFLPFVFVGTINVNL